MKKKLALIITVFCILISQSIAAQINVSYIDVVYLKNGSVVKGIIIENTPNANIKLQTSDGRIFVFNYEDILKFAKEASKAIPTIQTNYREKSPGLAFLFSFLLPGGGQYYNGEIIKGVTMTVLSLGSVVLMNIDGIDDTQLIIGESVMIASSLWSMIDALISANSINKVIRQDLATIKLGNYKYLSLSPDIKLSSTPILFGCSKIEPVVGIKLKLSL